MFFYTHLLYDMRSYELSHRWPKLRFFPSLWYWVPLAPFSHLRCILLVFFVRMCTTRQHANSCWLEQSTHIYWYTRFSDVLGFFFPHPLRGLFAGCSPIQDFKRGSLLPFLNFPDDTQNPRICAKKNWRSHSTAADVSRVTSAAEVTFLRTQ
jgi:hypothetical protein